MIDLRQGDCLEVMKDIPDKSVDLILCDLPYGTTACKWDVIIPFEPLWEQYNRIIKDNGAIVLFGSEPFSSRLRMSNIKNYKYDWIWEKSKATGHLNSKKRPLVKHELIHIFYKEKSTYNPQGLIKKDTPTISKGNRGKKGNGSSGDVYGKAIKDAIQTHTNYPLSILKFQVDMKAEYHPTQKPVALMEYLIKTYTNEKETVLDNCAGSMSTVIAALNTKRNCIAIEKDTKYFEIGKERVINHIKTNHIQN